MLEINDVDIGRGCFICTLPLSPLSFMGTAMSLFAVSPSFGNRGMESCQKKRSKLRILVI